MSVALEREFENERGATVSISVTYDGSGVTIAKKVPEGPTMQFTLTPKEFEELRYVSDPFHITPDLKQLKYPF